LQREKIGIPAQTQGDKALLKTIDNKKAKDKARQHIREEKNKNAKIELNRQKRLERQRENEYDQQNGLVQYGQVVEEEKATTDHTNNQDASSSASASESPKKKRKTEKLDMATKRKLLAAEGGSDKYWECDLCHTVVNKNEKANKQHRWNKQCNKIVISLLKQGFITNDQYVVMMQEKDATMAARKAEKQQQGTKKKSKAKKNNSNNMTAPTT
jgi:hypothetical protein